MPTTEKYAIKVVDSATCHEYYFLCDNKDELLFAEPLIRKFIESKTQLEYDRCLSNLRGHDIIYVSCIFDDPPACRVVSTLEY